MRILVTGATGQLGSALGSRLRPLGSIIATDRSMFDLSELHCITTNLDCFEPDFIINAAAHTAVDKAEEDSVGAFQINAEAPGVMAQWAAVRSVPIIHFSTDYVFDGTGRRPWTEQDLPRPINVYGASKLAGEQAVRAAGGCHLIIRTSWVYGANGNNFLRNIAHLAQSRRELRVVDDQIGAPTSTQLIADAVAQILAQGVTTFRLRAQKVEGLVHLAASGTTSWYQFATEIVGGLRARGVTLAVDRVISINTDDHPTVARRPVNSQLDLSRLRDTFGITPKHWRDALAPELDKLAKQLN